MLLAGFILAFGQACGMAPVNVGQLSPTISAPMVKQKIQAPLYLVLDPTKVPDKAVVTSSGMKSIEVENLRAFVTRDVALSMEAYFAQVRVVSPEFAPPADQVHAIADVRIDEIGAIVDSATSGGQSAGRVFGTLNWAFAVGVGGAPDYVFSFTGKAVGDFALIHVSQTGDMYEATFADAIGGLQSAFAGRDVPRKMQDALAAAATDSTPAAAGQTPGEAPDADDVTSDAPDTEAATELEHDGTQPATAP